LGKILIVNVGPVRELSAEAVAQAVAERLSEYKVAAVYFCPLPGVDEMAQVIAGRLGLQVELLPGLGEAQHVCWKQLSEGGSDSGMLDCGGAARRREHVVSGCRHRRVETIVRCRAGRYCCEA